MMIQEITITAIGETPECKDSAQRISLLLESTFCDSAWIHRCNGKVSVSRFSGDRERVVVNGIFSGQANGRDFSIPFKRDYLISNEVPASHWLGSPIFAFFMTIFRQAYSEQDPDKNTEDWITRSEFEIASKLEVRINKLVDAPTEGVRSIWRNSLIVGITLFLLAATTMTVYHYTHPHRLQDPPWDRFFGALMLAVFTGVPAGLAGVFLGLTFVGREVEDSVAGQSLLKLVGVRDAKGLRAVSIVGAIVSLGVTAAITRALIMQ